MKCRHCEEPLSVKFLDLGFQPPSNAYLSKEDLCKPETTYPLRLFVCTHCWLVQTEDYAKETVFFSPDYAYFSSTSTTWLAHAKRYCTMIEEQLALDKQSLVLEIGSNDGYLLRNFIEKNIPCLGIEPTDGTADAAERLGVPVIRKFFGEALARELVAQGKSADLVVGNNVYAHVPDINDFTRGLKAVLKPGGVITLEFPHLMRMIEYAQFDTVYHEHFSYLSVHTVSRIFEAAGLRIWQIEELPTHGGSLRVYGCHADDTRPTHASVAALLEEEARRGLQRLETYLNFQSRADTIKDDLLMFLIEQKRSGKKVVAYGAAAKGNTLLNYAGVKPDLLPFVCDAAKSKQGKYMPGSHIPILLPEHLTISPPDYVLVLPWNIAAEIQQQNAVLKNKGVQFVMAIPELMIV